MLTRRGLVSPNVNKTMLSRIYLVSLNDSCVDLPGLAMLRSTLNVVVCSSTLGWQESLGLQATSLYCQATSCVRQEASILYLYNAQDTSHSFQYICCVTLEAPTKLLFYSILREVARICYI